MPPPRETPRVRDITIHNKCRCVDKAETDKRQRTKSTTTCQEEKNNKENCRCISPGYLHLFLGNLSFACAQFLGYTCPELESLECSSGHSDIDTLAGASFFSRYVCVSASASSAQFAHSHSGVGNIRLR